ncbi:MAG: hypothetical protein ACK4NF_07570, partial [Planctomycetota bacterium]
IEALRNEFSKDCKKEFEPLFEIIENKAVTIDEKIQKLLSNYPADDINKFLDNVIKSKSEAEKISERLEDIEADIKKLTEQLKNILLEKFFSKNEFEPLVCGINFAKGIEKSADRNIITAKLLPTFKMDSLEAYHKGLFGENSKLRLVRLYMLYKRSFDITDFPVTLKQIISSYERSESIGNFFSYIEAFIKQIEFWGGQFEFVYYLLKESGCDFSKKERCIAKCENDAGCIKLCEYEQLALSFIKCILSDKHVDKCAVDTGVIEDKFRQKSGFVDLIKILKIDSKLLYFLKSILNLGTSNKKFIDDFKVVRECCSDCSSISANSDDREICLRRCNYVPPRTRAGCITQCNSTNIEEIAKTNCQICKTRVTVEGNDKCQLSYTDLKNSFNYEEELKKFLKISYQVMVGDEKEIYELMNNKFIPLFKERLKNEKEYNLPVIECR